MGKIGTTREKHMSMRNRDDAVEFGHELPQDRMTLALERVARLLDEAEAEGLDWELHRSWQRKMRGLKDVEEVERYADYLAA